MILRPETPADIGTIHQMTQAAFAGAAHRSGSEGAIIDALRAAGALTLSLVAEEAGQIVGHVALSPVRVAGRALGWYGLGPIAVRPDRQGQGVGGALIRDAEARLRAQGAAGCVLVGDPAYYIRFGFAADAGLRVDGVPPQYVLRKVYDGEAPQGVVAFHPAFGV